MHSNRNVYWSLYWQDATRIYETVDRATHPFILIPRLNRRWLSWRGVGQSGFAMTYKLITFEFVVPTVFAAAVGIVLSIGAVYLTERYLGPVDQSEANRFVADSRGIAEADPDRRLSRVHLLLSSMR